MKHQSPLFVCIFIGMLCSISNATESEKKQSSAPTNESTRPVLLLVDESRHPSVEVSWQVKGERQTFAATMGYTAPTGGDAIGHNVKCYVTMGGTRIETGAGHPKGAVVRLGVTKIENARAFFAGIDPNTEIEFAVTGIHFNQPIKYHKGTGIMHLKYALGDLKACSLPGTARNQYLLSDPKDTLGGRVIPGENATPGALDGGQGHGGFIIEIDKDDPTIISMRIRVPYGQLRHLQDPWMSHLPGTFFEPVHMHAEAEFIPVDVEPSDRDPIVPEVNEKIEAETQTDPEADS